MPMSIVELAQELERLRSTTKDVVVPTKSLRAVAEQGTVTIEIPDLGRLPLTRWGHEQLAEKTTVPFRYYNQMVDAGLADLAAQNVNAWLQKRHENGKEKLLIRSADSKVRAILSDRYRMMDSYDLAILTMERAKEHEATVQRCDLTDTHMYLKLVVPKYKEYLDQAGTEGVHVPEDEVIPGLVVSNSEVGAGAFRVEPFLFRGKCRNGMILEQKLYQVHLGHELDVGQLVFSDETRRLEDRVIWAKARDVIDSTFKPEVLKALVEKLRAARGMPIPDDKTAEVVDLVVKDAEISKEKRDDLLRYFAAEGASVFGLVNGITRLAQDYENADDQVNLERYAGRILYKPEIVVTVP